jgi:hypothetical protein
MVCTGSATENPSVWIFYGKEGPVTADDFILISVATPTNVTYTYSSEVGRDPAAPAQRYGESTSRGLEGVK